MIAYNVILIHAVGIQQVGKPADDLPINSLPVMSEWDSKTPKCVLVGNEEYVVLRHV